MTRLWAASLRGALAAAAAPSAVSHTALRCTAPLEVTRFKVTLPNTARAIHVGKGLVIVAIGSSSTQGVGASDGATPIPPCSPKNCDAAGRSSR